MRGRARVCAVVGCGRLQPCPEHASDHTHGRSPWRDRESQRWFRRALLLRSDGSCDRCGKSGVELFAHHDRPGWDPEHGRLLCGACHMAVDNMARH